MPNTVFSYDRQNLPVLPPRPERSNKRTFGRVLCICGSEGMAGAAYFAAKAAYRAGAGLVEILTPTVNRPVLQTLLPEAIVTGYEEQAWKDTLTDAINRADAIVIGCGLGQTERSRRVLAYTLRNRGEKPTVIDADGLNLISRHAVLLSYAKGAVLTPHPLEMSHLCGRSVEEILADPVTVAFDYAKAHGVICVLKDHETVVSDGTEKVYQNTTGNSGMATGGSGDVLAGMIGGILAQSQNRSLSDMELTALTVYLHGLCGDLSAERLGEHSVMASDLLDAIPDAMKTIQ